MDFFELLLDTINLRAFSSFWFWGCLVALWTAAAHWVLGVPFHWVRRAEQGDDVAQQFVDWMASTNADHLLRLYDEYHHLALGLGCFVITGLAITGWGYGVEFFQALFFLLIPLAAMLAAGFWSATRMVDAEEGELLRILRQHRLIIQICGVVFIFIAAFWGMYRNLNVGPFG